MNKQDLGKQRIHEIIGESSTSLLNMFSEISPDFAKYIVEFGSASCIPDWASMINIVS
ncbi:hypothetical protein [Legionella oakridgensis]|uniref:hypothetical protein n=1 Tax=Legionella oakridgensis TaxID=29423 RepID=UPI0012E3A6E8|nr:hypothetical protein [Legionella oakridgensis]